MSDPTPPGISPLAFWASVIGAFIFGGLADKAFQEVADLRPYVPPVFSTAATLACGDVDAYVRHVKDLNDHHVRQDSFGIHRQKTIDAVNELYDRARCSAFQDVRTGREMYKTLPANWLVDSNDPPAPAASVAAAPAPFPAAPVSAPTAQAAEAPAPRAYLTTRRRHVVITDDGTLDAAPLAPPAPKPHCGPGAIGIDWHVAGCP